MINLLPPQQKTDLKAARSNTRLLNYNIAILIAVGAMIGAFLVTYFYLTLSQDAAQASIIENRARETTYSSVKQQAATFRSDLATAKQILANQVNYSKLIVAISRSLPPGVVLESIQLDAASFGKPSTMTAKIKTVNDALKLKERFTANNRIFSNVNIQNISSSDQKSGYPYVVTLNVTINQGAAS